MIFFRLKSGIFRDVLTINKLLQDTSQQNVNKSWDERTIPRRSFSLLKTPQSGFFRNKIDSLNNEIDDYIQNTFFAQKISTSKGKKGKASKPKVFLT